MDRGFTDKVTRSLGDQIRRKHDRIMGSERIINTSTKD